FRRTGGWIWVATRDSDLADVTEPHRDAEVARWGRLDLASLGKEGKLWSHAEGAFSPDRVRPFSDRILGLLGWAPTGRSIRGERRVGGTRFTERIDFSTSP